MKTKRSNTSLYRIFIASLLTGVFSSVSFMAISAITLLTSGRGTLHLSTIFIRSISEGIHALTWYVPFLLSILLVVRTDSSRRSVVIGAIVIFTFGLIRASLQWFWSPFGFRLSILAIPVEWVVNFLGIVTAIWIGYNGGFDRLRASPLNIADLDAGSFVESSIGTDLTLLRGLFASILAGLITVIGLIVVGTFQETLILVSDSSAYDAFIGRVGISFEQIPMELVSVTSFLLAVLFVVKPQPFVIQLLKGITIVFAVKVPLKLAPMVISSSQSVKLWASQGPLWAPFGDCLILFAIAIAVWLAFYTDRERLSHRIPLEIPVIGSQSERN